jgi:hypothetical protein
MPDIMGMFGRGKPQAVPQQGQPVQSAIARAADATGVDFSYLLATAKRESSLNPNAKASTSSATGLFQFIDDTWLRVVDKYGDKHGLGHYQKYISIKDGRAVVSDPAIRAEILALRTDPELSARFAGELANENARSLKRGLGREPTNGELYAAHFLGPSGAIRMIRAAEANPNASAAELLPSAARANPSIFYSKGKPRSLAEVYANVAGPNSVVGRANYTPPKLTPVETQGESLWKQVPMVSDLSRLSGGMWSTLIDLQIEPPNKRR